MAQRPGSRSWVARCRCRPRRPTLDPASRRNWIPRNRDTFRGDRYDVTLWVVRAAGPGGAATPWAPCRWSCRTPRLNSEAGTQYEAQMRPPLWSADVRVVWCVWLRFLAHPALRPGPNECRRASPCSRPGPATACHHREPAWVPCGELAAGFSLPGSPLRRGRGPGLGLGPPPGGFVA